MSPGLSKLEPVERKRICFYKEDEFFSHFSLPHRGYVTYWY
jgi:hypothetical protein